MTVHAAQKSYLSSLISYLLLQEFEILYSAEMFDVICKKRTVVAHNNSGNENIGIAYGDTLTAQRGVDVCGSANRDVFQWYYTAAFYKIIKCVFNLFIILPAQALNNFILGYGTYHYIFTRILEMRELVIDKNIPGKEV